MDLEFICKCAFEQYPLGVIFSKTAPINVEESTYQVDYDQDFCYFYFSPMFEHYTTLSRYDMCTGTVNCKRDFPDYEAYFVDDINVLKQYKHGNILSLCEPWSPPGMSSYVYTRKTAMESNGNKYMLGCFTPIDDTVIGIAKFKRVQNLCKNQHRQLMLPSTILDDNNRWFLDAFLELPMGMAIWNDRGDLIEINRFWKEYTNSMSFQQLSNYFSPFDFRLSSESLYTSAAWCTMVPIEFLNTCVDIGVYGIDVLDVFYTIVVLRPSMTTISMETKRWKVELI